MRIVDRVPASNPAWTGDNPDPGSSQAPYRLYNIGNHRPENLLTFIETLERIIGVRARRRVLPLQLGDVPSTCADILNLRRDIGFAPSTNIAQVLERFVAWYRRYYQK